jgi:hypothetical protein
MYYSYSYYSMKLKPDMARYSSVSSTGSYTYSDWKSQLSDSNWHNWSKFSKQFGETFQFAFLRGMTVIGIECSDWDSLFGDVTNESAPFQGMAKLYLQGQLKADWRFFAQKIAKETYKNLHYPAGYPDWLFPYGYNQQMYLQDLTIYWDNIHDDYYKAWEITQIGEDSPEVARMKRLGQVARQEIDQVARQGQQHLKR